jgi:hypothetical protein
MTVKKSQEPQAGPRRLGEDGKALENPRRMTINK